jgi:ornithine carbamoyltransferase
MSVNLRGRNFLKELDFTQREWRWLLDLSAELKRAKATGLEDLALTGLNIALVFEKASTRTRCAFEVAAHDQGAHVTYLDPDGSQLGHKESVRDTARVLGRLFDGIQYRGFTQDSAETLGRLAGVPVWNGLTDAWHPTQALCDMLTMRERAGKADRDIAFAFCGDARNSVGNSLLVAGAMMGMDVRMVGPRPLWNHDDVVKEARRIADETGARIRLTDDPRDGVRGVDFVHTDGWVSMGEPPAVWDQRIALLRSYQVNMDLLAATGNPRVMFMHRLPAFHDRHTEVGEEIYEKTGLPELEVTNEVFESPFSIVFDQAENRMHTIKAVMVATLGM